MALDLSQRCAAAAAPADRLVLQLPHQIAIPLDVLREPDLDQVLRLVTEQFLGLLHAQRAAPASAVALVLSTFASGSAA
jgi:hypothetical protein